MYSVLSHKIPQSQSEAIERLLEFCLTKIPHVHVLIYSKDYNYFIIMMVLLQLVHFYIQIYL